MPRKRSINEEDFKKAVKECITRQDALNKLKIAKVAFYNYAKYYSVNVSKFKKQHKNIVGNRFGKLLVLEMSGTVNQSTLYKCICDCGKEKIIRRNCLVMGRTKSCGCLLFDPATQEAARKVWTKNPPSKSSYSLIYTQRYNDGDISLDEFIEMSKNNCHYCNLEPICSFNRFKEGVSLDFSYRNGFIKYNGLDRIDSNKSHTKSNVVTCCKFCNVAKMDMDYNHFLKKINEIYKFKCSNYDNNLFNIKLPNLSYKYKDFIKPNKINSELNLRSKFHPYVSAISSRFQGKYKDGDLKLEEFYELSQMNCFYCNSEPSNIAKPTINNFEKFAIKYNGLDRLDSNKKHNLDNIVPCCKYCNQMKNDRTIQEFDKWINDIVNNLNLISKSSIKW